MASSSLISNNASEGRCVGFGIKSTAPSSIALNTLISSPLLLMTITGVGDVLISMRRNVKPSITGISKSSVMRSGLSLIACFSPSFPSVAVATTSTPWMDSRSLVNVRRLNAESSITRTLIGLFIVYLPMTIDSVVIVLKGFLYTISFFRC